MAWGVRLLIASVSAIALKMVAVSTFTSNYGAHALTSLRVIARRADGTRLLLPSSPAILGSAPLTTSIGIIGVRSTMATVRSMSSSAAAVSDSDSKSAKPFFRIYYNDVYTVHLPPRHRFPMDKYRKARVRAQELISALPREEQDRVDCEFKISPLSPVFDLATTHSREYIHRFMTGDQNEQELRNVGFPWSLESVDRSLSSVGGTVAAARDACDVWRAQHKQGIPPWGAHVAGGTHHAFFDRGEGFCVFSDIAVAANVILRDYPDIVQKILIVDLDVHQGNGNAVLFQNRTEVDTFSLHCRANYFSAKQQSDLDIELPSGCTDQTYLITLNHWLKTIRRKGGPYDLVFFQSGVDVIKEDRLGRMSLTQDGVARRNELVYNFAHDLNVPLVISMGGGYPKNDDWEPIIQAHANVYVQAFRYLAQIGAREEIFEASSSGNTSPYNVDGSL